MGIKREDVEVKNNIHTYSWLFRHKPTGVEHTETRDIYNLETYSKMRKRALNTLRVKVLLARDILFNNKNTEDE